MKPCTACKVVKPLDEFSRNKSNKKDGRAYRCKPCDLMYRRKREGGGTPHTPAQIRQATPWLYAKPFATEART